MRPVNRIAPALPVRSMQTYAVAAPKTTVPATCEEVGCGAYLHGWRLRIDELPADMVYAAEHSGRTYQRMEVADGETWLEFAPGQPCFRAATHVRPVSTGPDRYGVIGGDWRGSTGVIRRHAKPEDWVEDFATHQDALATRLAQG